MQGAPYGHLKPGREYVVREAFIDFDGSEHPVGERWVFEGHSFLPYDDGLTLIVSGQWIRLQDRPEAQGAIVDRLEQHIGLAAEG